MSEFTGKFSQLANKTVGTQRGSELCRWHCPEGICQVPVALSLGHTFPDPVIHPPTQSACEVSGDAVNNTLTVPLQNHPFHRRAEVPWPGNGSSRSKSTRQ